ncbi:MAG: EAL domain-containing protein [Ilumatobacteraceae bacterium]
MEQPDRDTSNTLTARRGPWFAAVASPWRNPARVLLVASLIVAGVDLGSLVGPVRVGHLVTESALHLSALGLVAAVLVCRALAGRPQAAWAVIAGGAVTIAASAWLALIDGREARMILGAATLAARIAIGAGAVLLISRRPMRGERLLRLDGVITGLGAAALGAAIWFDSVVEGAPEPIITLVALMVPLVDLVLIAVLADALVSRRSRATTSSWLLVGGLTVMTTADVGHLRAVVTTSATPGWASAGWLVGLLLVALAAAAPTVAATADPTAAVSNAGVSAVPTMLSAVSLGVLAYGINHDLDIVASLLALASVGLVIVLRTTLTMRELRRAQGSYLMARTDELTGLANRRGFIEEVDRLLATKRSVFAVTIIDLNGFKDVNDTLGHHVGDELLSLLAQRFRSTLADRSVIARLGGDEFGIVTSVADAAGGLAIAESARRVFDAPFEIEETSVQVGAAIGVALYPEHADALPALLRCADVAMYDAKRSHGGVAMYVPLTDFNADDKMKLLEELTKVIDERRLTVHYLPTVDLHSGCVVASEALVRWRHPTRGLLAPHAFVPMAERAGLIRGITRAVIAQAIAFHAELFPGLAVSVNISHCDLADDSLGEYLEDLLEIYRFEPAQLTLEIAERALTHDPMRAAGALAAIRARGVRVSIDGFGLEYSSNARLFEMPVDEVKIDRSIVGAIESDERCLAIVRSTVRLASALGIETVAAGIESDAVRVAVTGAGIRRAQGFAIGMPVPSDDYAQYLASVGQPASRPTL